MGRAIVRVDPRGGKRVCGYEGAAALSRALVVYSAAIVVPTVYTPCDEGEPVPPPWPALEGDHITLQQRDLGPVAGAGHDTWCVRCHLPLFPGSTLNDSNLAGSAGCGRQRGWHGSRVCGGGVTALAIVQPIVELVLRVHRLRGHKTAIPCNSVQRALLLGAAPLECLARRVPAHACFGTQLSGLHGCR